MFLSIIVGISAASLNLLFLALLDLFYCLESIGLIFLFLLTPHDILIVDHFSFHDLLEEVSLFGQQIFNFNDYNL